MADARDRAPRVRNRAPAPIQVSLPSLEEKMRGTTAKYLSIDHLGAAVTRGTRATRAIVRGSKTEDSGFRGVEGV